jgi:hypothetical protein
MELQHFSHEHPLTLNEELNKDHERFICVGCLNQMLGPNYTCKECHEFILHKSCAELPRELEHPLHPKHPLLLIYRYFRKREIKCEGCNGEDKGASFTIVLAVILASNINVLHYRSPSKLKLIMNTN